jgi:hypothetical protein
MDNVRNIISNLFIYKLQNSDNLNINKLIIKSKIDETEINEKTNQDVNNSLSRIRNNQKIYENINSNNKSKRARLDNYNQKYIALRNNNFLKNEVNYVLKNKELLREQELQMKELKLKRENDALNLLLNSKSKNSNAVRSKLYDYEIKQMQNKIKLLKRNESNLRNSSSQRPLRNFRNNYYINSDGDENEYRFGKVHEYSNKPKVILTKSVKLPKIQIKPSTSPILEKLPVLHKDFGRMPDYLAKRKKEIKEQKELEMIRKKQKNLPSGYKILSEAERQERLNILTNEKVKLEEELYKLPIARISEKQKKLKAEIEKSLYEIDEKMYKLIGYKEVIIKEES